jgi:hypothetical protein
MLCPLEHNDGSLCWVQDRRGVCAVDGLRWAARTPLISALISATALLTVVFAS